MAEKRTASEQVAFRVEPELHRRWADFVGESLAPNRAHHVCAMLSYLAASPARREQLQRAYVRFQRSGQLELPAEGADAAMTADERELLRAYRLAGETARDEAIANLLDQPASASHTDRIGGTPDHRAG